LANKEAGDKGNKILLSLFLSLDLIVKQSHKLRVSKPFAHGIMGRRHGFEVKLCIKSRRQSTIVITKTVLVIVG